MESIYDNIKDKNYDIIKETDFNIISNEEILNFLVRRPWYYHEIVKKIKDFNRKLTISYNLIHVHPLYIRVITLSDIFENYNFVRTYINSILNNYYYLQLFHYCYSNVSNYFFYNFSDEFLLEYYKKWSLLLLTYTGNNPDLLYVKPIINKTDLVIIHDSDFKSASQQAKIDFKIIRDNYKLVAEYNNDELDNIKEFNIFDNLL